MSTPRRPPGRYDEPRGPLPRAVLVAGAALLGLALLALALLAYSRYGGGGVSAGVLAYEVVDDRTVEVRFEVRKDPGTTVFCRVRARNRDGAEVGSEVVEVGPSDDRRVVVVHRLRTSDRPLTGELDGCRPSRRSP